MRRTGLILLAVLVSTAGAAWPQGNPLGPEFRVNTHTPLFQTISSVLVDSSGNFVVTWTSYGQDGSSNGVFGQRYLSSGAPVGPEFRVNSYTSSDQVYPSAAADTSGNFVVVWMSDLQDGSNRGIFGQRFASSGAPFGPEFRVNTYTTNNQTVPSVASDGLGNFVVVWYSSGQDGSSSGIFGQRYASSGAPIGAEFQVNTYTTGVQLWADVAMDASGNFVVVWNSDEQDGSESGVFGQRYASSGAPLGPEFQVNTYTMFGQYQPSVAVDTSGNFIVVWQSEAQDGNGDGVFGQRYASSGAPLGSEFRANTYTLGGQRCSIPPFQCVAADGAGNFVVIWESAALDGSLAGVFGQRYASSGAPLGAEFRVNTNTVNNQFRAAVGADDLGNFVVVWTSYAGSNSDVFGQRYAQIVPVELMHFKVQ